MLHSHFGNPDSAEKQHALNPDTSHWIHGPVVLCAADSIDDEPERQRRPVFLVSGGEVARRGA
jgi:hypothetical protein